MNLRYKHRPLLINSLTVADFGAYIVDDPDGYTTKEVKHLVVKKIGLDLPFVTGNTVTVSKTQEGAKKSVLLETIAPGPASLFNYDYGIEIIKKVKNPGVLNDDWVKKSRFYGGSIAALQALSGGELADADKLTIEDDIITQIHEDRGGGTREESIVDARRVYLVTLTNAVTDEINATNAAGATTNLHLDGGVTVHTAVEDFNTDATTATLGLVAFAKDATHMYITSEAEGVLFTIADGGGGSTVVVDNRYIWLTARSVDEQYEVVFDNGFLTLSRFNVLVLANAWTAGNTMFSVNGVNSDAITLAAHSHDSVTAINADAHFPTYAYASTEHSGNVGSPIWIYSGIYEVKVLYLSTGVTVTNHYSGGGVYPNLTWEDVFREFSEAKHLGGFANLVSTVMPVTGDKYCKITINATVPHVTMHGASQVDTQQIKQDIYLKQGYGTTHLWHDTATADASGMWESTTDNAAFSATKDINELITYWGFTITTIV